MSEGGRTRSRAGTGRSGRRRTDEPAARLPVARVAVDVPLAHLDRPFDYLVPASMDEAARPGVRVRVRFAGQLVDGFLLERVGESTHPGRLAMLDRVVSAEPVLTAEVARLARTVADRYAGTLADVLRLAVPPRHARAEAAPRPEAPSRPVPPPADPGPWARYPDGPAFLAALAAGSAPRAVWTALPGPDWPDALALAVRAAAAAEAGAVVVVPDGRDVTRLDTALSRALGPGRHLAITADLGPEERYRRWLAALRGDVLTVVGTRAAAFAPVRRLGLVAVWDDGDDLHAEPRAPYPHVREILTLRAHLAGSAALVGGFASTAECAQLLRAGWAGPLAADRERVRRCAPLVRVAGEDTDLAADQGARTARLPTAAWRAARDALARGPVLVHVPRRGYLPGLGCVRCRAPARCLHCGGPLALPSGHAVAHCGWCGRPAGRWRCPVCAATAFRAQIFGADRTSEELGRAFPRVPVRTSGGEAVLGRVGPEPALVVATPGAEPVADGGYAAALLLDGWALLARPDLRAAEEALRRWLGAAALVQPRVDGGTVVLLADPGLVAAQALIRWDPAGFAERELAERATLGFPPAMRVAALTGTREAVADLLEVADLPPGADVLGPVPLPPGRPARSADQQAARQSARQRARQAESPADGPVRGERVERALVRVPRAHGPALAEALRAGQAVRSARKAERPVRVNIDPLDIG